MLALAPNHPARRRHSSSASRALEFEVEFEHGRGEYFAEAGEYFAEATVR